MPIPDEVTAGGALAGGAIIGHLTSWWVARKKTPAEVDSIIVTSAETTVQGALKLAAAQAARADRAEARVAEQDAQIENLLARVESLLEEVNAVRAELYAIKNGHEGV